MDAEQLGGVGPGVDGAEASAGRQGAEFGDRIFVGIFGVNKFVFGEAEAGAGNARFLRNEAANVDFDPSLSLIVESDMLESVDLEVGVEFAVDALEEVEVEGGGNPGSVVVGGVEDLGILFQIDADQHLAAGTENTRVIGEKGHRRVGLEIANRRAREETDLLAARAGQGRQRETPGVVGAHSEDRNRREILGKRSGGVAQMLTRDVDGDVGVGLIERPKENSHLLAGAAAELDQAAIAPHLGRDVTRVVLEDHNLGTGQIVFGQAADCLEKGGAARVVKEFARYSLAGAAEPAQDGVAKAFLSGSQIMEGKSRAAPHSTSSASLTPAKAQRAEGGKKLRYVALMLRAGVIAAPPRSTI